jgi:hypothetical protein
MALFKSIKIRLFTVLFLFFYSASYAHIDSCRVFYYSFLENKNLDLKELGMSSKMEKIFLCEGQELQLQAKASKDAKKGIWLGPNNLSSHSKNLYIEKVNQEHSGVYSYTYTDVYGPKTAYYQLQVNPAIRPEIKVRTNENYLKLNLEHIPQGTQTCWINADQHIFTEKTELIISKKIKEEQGLFLKIKSESCVQHLKII